MNPAAYQEIKGLFEKYIELYSSRDDLLTDLFSSDFSGFAGGADHLVKDRAEWIAVTRQDFAQVKEKIQIDVKDLAIQSLAEDIAVATSFFSIRLPIEDDYFSRETARLVLIFHRQSGDWKIAHSSISIPYGLVREGEIYPLKGVHERNRLLEQIIAERTNELETANQALKSSVSLLNASLEATADGILIVDREGKITKWNQKFAEMWRIPEGIFASQDDDSAISHVLSQLTKPEQFVARVKELYMQPMLSSFDQIEFLDGRIFERSSLPQRIGDDIVGRVWSFRDITERKLVEARVHDLAAIVQSSEDAIIGKNLDGIITSWNKGAERLYGYLESEMLGKSISLLIPSDHKDEMPAILEMIRSGKHIHHYETVRRKKGGEDVQVSLAISPIRDHVDTIVAASSIGRDITESKKAEEVLRESEEKFAGVFRHALVWIAVTDIADGKYLEVNPQTLSATGFSREEMVGHTAAEIGLVTKKERSRLVDETRRHGRIVDFEMNFNAKDGRRLHGLVSGEQVVIGGRPCLLTVTADITERTNREEELRKERDFIKSITETSPIGITRLNCDGEIQFANPRAEQILGLSRKAIEGLPYNAPTFSITAIDGDDFPDEQLPFQRVKTSLAPVTDVQHAITWADGKRVLLSINATPHFDHEGRFDGMVASLQDITERKLSERLTQALYGISQAVHSTDKLNELFEQIQLALANIVPVDNFFIALLTSDKQSLCFPYEHDEDGTTETITIRIDDPQSLTAEVFRSKTPLLLNEKELHDRYSSGRNRVWVAAPKCWLGVPLMIREEAIGVMAIQDYRRGDVYGPKDVALFESAAGQIAIAIERKQAEEALHQSELRFRSVWDHSADGMRLTDRDGRIIDVNDAFCKLVKMSRAELLGRTFSVAYQREGPDDDLKLYHQRFDAKETISNLFGSPTLWNGETLYLDITSSFIETAGQERLLLSLLRDVTEHRRAEDALKESEFFFKESQRAGAIGSYRTDFVAGFWNSSEVLDSIFGIDTNYSRSVQGWLDIVHPDDRETLDEYLRTEVISKRKRFSKEYRIIRKNDGATRWVYGLGDVEFDIRGTIVSMIGTIQDITERKKTEDALRHAQKLESIGTLAGGIAHDFNNLLNAMLGQSSLALGKLSPESPAKSHIDKSIRAAERAADLTRQLLAYSGKGKFATQVIDLNRLVRENIQMLEISVPKTAELQFDLVSPPPHIRGDVGQIQQVIMNLIINAGEALGLNPGSINVRTGRLELTQNDDQYWKYTTVPHEPGIYALLEVSDNGHGMKPDVLDRIFDPFFTTKFTGRGLGLAAVLGIIKGHQGGLRITSEEGKGTQFEIVLPLVETSTMTDVGAANKAAVVDGEGKTILIIDDEPAVLELLIDIFKEAKFEVLGAMNPLEGIQLYRQRHKNIAVVILDYSMPGMDGKVAFEELLKINKDVKVLICSGYAKEGVESAFGALRPAGFLKKPYQPAMLLERVSRVLSE